MITFDAKTIAKAVRRANVVYDLAEFQSGHEYLPPYLANGWIGGCLDEFGFPAKPNFGYDHGRRHIGYVNHYYRYENNGHNQAALLAMFPRRADGRNLWIGDLTKYRQVLDLYNMTLTTNWAVGDALYRVSSFASMATPELYEMNFSCAYPAPRDALVVRLCFDLLKAENNARRQAMMESLKIEIAETPAGWRVRSITNCVTTDFLVAGVNLKVALEGNELVVTVPAGKSSLRLLILDRELGGKRDAAIQNLSRPSSQWRREHRAAAAAFWARSGLFLPQGPAALVWTRSAYYLASAVAPMPTHIMEPTGLNSNIWKHGFPQDMYYVTENLARLNHAERAEAQMPYWLDNLEAVKRYTHRIAERDGAFYPWIPPFKDWDEFEKNGITNHDAYEFHNASYVVAMAWNCFKITCDHAFLERHFPILEEVTRFYLSLTVLPPGGGRAQIRHPNLRSQDEASDMIGEKSNALCCFWAALYTLRAYQEACRVLGRPGELQPRVTEVLAAGYDFAALERSDGTLKVYAEDARPLGQQKHPVQLNAICYLPLPDFIDGYAPVRKSWERRYDLTAGALVPASGGWTFGEFTLASARMRSGKEVARDLSMVQPARYADPYWIQFYESSSASREPWHMKSAYYFTTSGLYLQALTDCVVQYCRGTLDLFAAILPDWEDRAFFFHGLRTDGGLKVSGNWRAGAFRVTIEPSRDVAIPVRVSRDIKGIHAVETSGAAWTFDGQTDYPLTFHAGHVVTLEWA